MARLPRPPQRITSGIAALLGCVGFAPAASAASGWLPPADISTRGAALVPTVAMDGEGNAVAVWRDGGPGPGDVVVVKSAVRPAGGPWSAPVDLSRPGFDGAYPLGGFVGEGPQVAVNARGDAVAVWQRRDGGQLVVQAATRPAGGTWSAPVDVSGTFALGNARGPRVVIDRQGNAVAMWARHDPFTNVEHIESAERPAGRSWQAPVQVSAPGRYAARPELAIDAQGTALAVWGGGTGAAPYELAQSAARPAGGTWQAPEDIPDSIWMTDPDLALDRAGNAVVVWSVLFAADARAAVRLPSGGWQTTQLASAYGARVALDDHGTAVATWAEADGVHAATRPAAGDWLPGSLIGPASAVRTDVAVESHGDAIAVWSDLAGPRPEIRASRRVAGAWTPSIRLSADERSAIDPRIAVDPNGNGVAVWSDTAGGVVSAAGLDGSAPRLRSLTVPATGHAGRRVALSASAFDVWALGGAPAWDFGDGTTASGNAVSHAYARVGPLAVRVTVSDLVGNATTETRTIVVKPSVLGLRVTPSRFRAARRGSMSFRLPVASRVRFVVQRVAAGRRVGRRCVARTPANRRRSICNRYIRVGAFTLRRPSGRQRVRLAARVGGRVLRAGRYRLKATPTAAGLTGSPSRTGFRVTR